MNTQFDIVSICSAVAEFTRLSLQLSSLCFLGLGRFGSLWIDSGMNFSVAMLSQVLVSVEVKKLYIGTLCLGP